ncbi:MULTISPECIES: metallophosphoesterase [Neoroseomonas]|uniref:Serine/threonine protein phosphatase n=2 Tax=Neoroseomonas TaxID=2870716 RepID=A0A9X9WG10_9PROT|nr:MULTISPECIES: metallophosphoesterase [Neoroseomonas]MBR0659270.1 serine/threonine protein phosphatase [Neoroseomonas oryzicola]NKE15596.1 serine/threonine protein phosphatase [Neoroseomonas oryzicola]NMJ41585.1 serine/threonine protein phosphatase [Neoroseomonas marina]
MIELREAPGSLPRGRRIYAIGDIHGTAARLRDLHARIAEDLRARPVASALLLHLGDYVDKGTHSRDVVDYLIEEDPVPGLDMLNLTGNHEETMLAALEGDGAAAADWLWGGGRATLESWGIDPEAPRDAWGQHFTAPQMRFLRRLHLHHQEGGYLFVHAGIRPGIPLEDQSREDLLRIRHDFLGSERDHGVVVVHGHTAGFNPVVRDNRICLDTAAWSGGPLTCGVFEGDRVGFLQA